MKDQEKFTVFLTTNSSGEIATWVKTIVSTIRQKQPDWRIIVTLMPYRHATGGEARVLSEIPGIEAVLTAKESTKLMWSKIWPKRLDFPLAQKGALLFLGGDQFQAGLLARKIGLPACAYIQDVARWPGLFRYLFIPRRQVLDKIKKTRIAAVKIVFCGDLVTDAARLNLAETLGPDQAEIIPAEIKKICRAKLRIPWDRQLVVFMPGSNSSWYKYVTPELVAAGERVRQELPEVEPYLIVSPFISPAERSVTEPPIRQNKSGRWQMGEGEQKGVALVQGPAQELVAAADLLVTVPGTKTAEAAVLGTPMLMFLPLNRPDLIPMDGLVGLIVGSRVLKFIWPGLIAAAQHFKTLLALPNIYAGKEMIPELVGKLSAETIARKVIEILKDKSLLDQMRQELPKTMGQPGAAARIVETLSAIYRQSGGSVSAENR